MGIHVVTVLAATILSAAGVAWCLTRTESTTTHHCQRTYLTFFFIL